MFSNKSMTVVPLAGRPVTEAGAAPGDRRVSANLAVLADLIRRYGGELAARGETINSRDLLAVLGGVAARLELLSRLHQELAPQGGDARINLSEGLRAICEDLAATMPPPGRIVLSHRLARDCLVPADQALPLALIACEIVGNAIRHAHPADVVGFINVCCWRDAAEGVLLDIADDGIGLPPGFNPLTDSGFGLRLVRELSQQLGATCVFDDSGLGLHFRLRIPVAAGYGGLTVATAAGRNGRS